MHAGWPQEWLCYKKRHVNAKRPPRASFGAEVLGGLSDLLAPDRAIYDAARTIHSEQAARHAGFRERLAAFQPGCRGVDVDAECRDAKRSGRTRSAPTRSRYGRC